MISIEIVSPDIAGRAPSTCKVSANGPQFRFLPCCYHRAFVCKPGMSAPDEPRWPRSCVNSAFKLSGGWSTPRPRGCRREAVDERLSTERLSTRGCRPRGCRREAVDERVSARGCRQEAVDKMLNESPSFAAGALCTICQQLREHEDPTTTLKTLGERLGEIYSRSCTHAACCFVYLRCALHALRRQCSCRALTLCDVPPRRRADGNTSARRSCGRDRRGRRRSRRRQSAP